MKIVAAFIVALATGAISRWARIPSLAPQAIVGIETSMAIRQRHLIKPIATQGHIGDVQPNKIVYDAQTTSGGSGGLLFDDQGHLIGINFAMVRDFGGSNFAIPVRFGQSFLKP